MKIKDLRDKNIEELEKILREKREVIRKIRFDIATKQVKGVRQLRKEKKDVAMILTLINENHGK